MFNIVPCWIYGTEIWPQEIRAKGYSFTIFGWACGCGMTQFVIPIMLGKLGYGTYIFFGLINIVSIPIIWFLFPEVAKHSLEEVNLLFTSDSLLVSSNMKEYHRRVDGAAGDRAVARGGCSTKLTITVGIVNHKTLENLNRIATNLIKEKLGAENIQLNRVLHAEDA